MKTSYIANALASVALCAFASAAYADDKVTLSMWHQHPEWKDRAEAILEKFESEHPNIEIDLEEIAGTNYTARLNTALAAGEAPDLFGLPAGPETVSAAEAGYLTDLTGKLDLSSLVASAASAVENDGKIHGVPILGSYTVGLYYHRDIMEEQGLTPPKTREEFLSVCTTLKERGINPLVVPASDGIVPSFMYMMAAASVMGADGFDELRAGSRKFTDPDLVEAAAFIQEIAPCLQPGALSTAYVEGKALAAMKQGAMMPGGSADYAGYQEINPEVDLGVVPFPAAKGGTPATVTGLEYIFTINSQSEHKEEALIFLQWMLEETAQQMVVDTITMTTNKNVVPTDNRILEEFGVARASNDVRVFYELPEVGSVFGAAQNNIAALLLGEMTPEAFSELLQAEVKPSDM